jgi:hypothetical protein
MRVHVIALLMCNRVIIANIIPSPAQFHYTDISPYPSRADGVIPEDSNLHSYHLRSHNCKVKPPSLFSATLQGKISYLSR